MRLCPGSCPHFLKSNSLEELKRWKSPKHPATSETINGHVFKLAQVGRHTVLLEASTLQAEIVQRLSGKVLAATKRNLPHMLTVAFALSLKTQKFGSPCQNWSVCHDTKGCIVSNSAWANSRKET